MRSEKAPGKQRRQIRSLENDQTPSPQSVYLEILTVERRECYNLPKDKNQHASKKQHKNTSVDNLRTGAFDLEGIHIATIKIPVKLSKSESDEPTAESDDLRTHHHHHIVSANLIRNVAWERSAKQACSV